MTHAAAKTNKAAAAFFRSSDGLYLLGTNFDTSLT